MVPYMTSLLRDDRASEAAGLTVGAQQSGLIHTPTLQVTADLSTDNPLMAGAATERETAAVVIFAGRYYSGLPYEDPATVFLKASVQATN